MTDSPQFRPAAFLGSSPALLQTLDRAGMVAGSDQSLFIGGESGTGKDLLARAIHDASGRDGSFVTLNGSAVPDGILDREIYGPPGPEAPTAYAAVPRFLSQAQGGTLYLDDVCRMSAAVQARLLELLRTGRIVRADGASARFTARIIAATNSDLAASLRESRLRRDLYDHLAVNQIVLPPLRHRDGDAGQIAAAVFPDQLANFGFPVQSLAARTIARINALPWPGNVRQLLNVLRRMALTPEAASGRGAELPPDVLADAATPATARPPEAPLRTFDEIERQAILDAIDRYGGSVQKAADELELAASTIYRKLKFWQSR